MNLNIFRKPTSENDVITLLKTRRLLFWVVVASIALLFMAGDSLPISGIGAFLLMLILVPVCICLGFLAFLWDADSALKEFRLEHCTCGEPVTYYEGVKYFMTGTKYRNTFRNKDNGDIDTYIREDYIIEYTCPRCKATRRYKDQFVTDRIKKNIAGVELYHTKDNLEESDVQKFFRSGLRTATLLDNTDK